MNAAAPSPPAGAPEGNGRFRAALFDLGGVVLTSPLDGFDDYERRAGLPAGLIRRLNSTNPDVNAWACYERGEISEAEFVVRFEDEGRLAGHEVSGEAVLGCLAASVRPEMVAAIRRLRSAGLRTAAVTNNVSPLGSSGHGEVADLLPLFDVVVESSVERVRKPEPAFYELALSRLGVEASECVFLDDLGVNLKSARAMGMTTIKVGAPDVALAELSAAVGIPLDGAAP